MVCMRDQLHATALKFIEVQSGFDFDRMKSLRTPTCCSSLIAPSRKIYKTSDQVQPSLEASQQIFKTIKYSLLEENDIIIDESERKVVLCLRGHFETTVGPYVNDFIFILTMTEDGKLVADIKSILDTVILAELETRLEQCSQSSIPWLAHLTKEDVQGTALQDTCN